MKLIVRMNINYILCSRIQYFYLTLRIISVYVKSFEINPTFMEYSVI